PAWLDTPAAIPTTQTIDSPDASSRRRTRGDIVPPVVRAVYTRGGEPSAEVQGNGSGSPIECCFPRNFYVLSRLAKVSILPEIRHFQSGAALCSRYGRDGRPDS